MPPRTLAAFRCVRFPPIAVIGEISDARVVKRRVALAMLVACTAGANAESRNNPSEDEVVFCGGKTDVVTVERYFSELRDALAKPGPTKRFNAFVGPTFGTRSRSGRTLYFNVKDIGSVTPGRISIAEWREISRRSARSLNNAGWRGCFMDHGKVWFEGSEQGGFRLTLIAHDMAWVTPERGDALP